MKRLLSLIACLALALVFVLPASASAGPKVRWKVGTLAPKGVGYAKQVEDVLLPILDQATGKGLELKIYWGGVMGDDEDHIKKIRIGQLHAAGLAAQGTVLACPEMAVLELPFLFNDYGEVDHVRDAMLPEFEKYMEAQGFKFVVWIDQDFDQIYSTKYPMDRLSDFSRSRFVTWFGPLEEAMLTRLGSSPVPINVPEIAASVRQGIVDAQFAPAIWMVGTQMYSVVRFVNPVKMRYSPATIIVSVEAWNALPAEYQKGIWDTRIRCQRLFVADTRRDNAKCLDAMIRYGVKEVRISPQDLAEIKARAIPLWDEMADKLYPRTLLDRVQAELAEYRASKAPQNTKPATPETNPGTSGQ